MRIKLVINKSLFIFLFLLLGITSFSQLSYTFERLDTESGLPTNTIKGLQFDENNRFLWIATESGIVRYNGHNVQIFEDQDERSILNNRVAYFTKAEDGSLFGKFANGTGFSINKNEISIGNTSLNNIDLNQYIETKHKLRLSKSIKNIFTNNYRSYKVNNDILSINDGYLLRFKSEKVDSLASFNFELQGFQIGDRLFTIDRNNIISEVKIINDSIKHSTIVSIKKVYHFEKYFEKADNLKVFQDLPLDDAFIIISNKLYRIINDGNDFSFELLIDNLPFNEYNKFIQFDRATQTIYIGTDNRGVIICRPKNFNRVSPNNMMENTTTSAYAQVILKNGSIQINDGPIFGNAKDNSAFIFYKRAEPVFFISSKNILYFTNNDGIVEYDLARNKPLNKKKNEFNIRNIFVEVYGLVYGINQKGIFKKNYQNQWRYLLKFSKIPFNFLLFEVKMISTKELLIASSDGVYKYNFEKNSFKLFYRDNIKAAFRSIYKLGDYYLLGSYGGGVYIYKNDSIKKVPSDPNGYLKFANCFIEDERDNIWISTNKGLFYTTKKSVKEFWNYGIDGIRYRYFGKLDGIDVLEMNGGCTPCAIKLPNGDISLPGIDGLIQFNPNNLTKHDYNNIQPNIFIDNVYVDNSRITLESFNKPLPSQTKNINIHLAISGMLSEENIIIEYRFGLNEKWQNLVIKNPVIHLNKSFYGQYKVYVRFRNTAISKSRTILIPFYIKFPIFLHPLMILAYLIIVILLIFFYIRIKTLLYQKRQKALEDEVNSKTKSLLSINKFLIARNRAKEQGLAIVNHDILTPLKYLHISASSLLEKTDNDEYKETVQEIVNTTKELEYLTRNILHWVKYDNTNKLINNQDVNMHLLTKYLIDYTSPFLSNKDIIFENRVPVGSIINNWLDPLRVLLYNILVNAIKSTEKGSITISIEQSDTTYKIKISDTGIGMSESMSNYLTTGKGTENVEITPKYTMGYGVGFKIIRNIVKLMKAKLIIESIENVGTSVSIEFTNQKTSKDF